MVYINNNDNFVMDNINPSSFPTAKDLPVIRYILPIPALSSAVRAVSMSTSMVTNNLA